MTLPVASAPAAVTGGQQLGTSGQNLGWDLPPVQGGWAGVAALSVRKAVAVGYTGLLGGHQRALVARWNGAVWRTLSSRALPRQSALGAVALFPQGVGAYSGGAWAVGLKDTAGHGRDFFPLIVRVTELFAGQVPQVPGPGTGDGSGLRDVAATAAENARGPSVPSVTVR